MDVSPRLSCPTPALGSVTVGAGAAGIVAGAERVEALSWRGLGGADRTACAYVRPEEIGVCGGLAASSTSAGSMLNALLASAGAAVVVVTLEAERALGWRVDLLRGGMELFAWGKWEVGGGEESNSRASVLCEKISQNRRCRGYSTALPWARAISIVVAALWPVLVESAVSAKQYWTCDWRRAYLGVALGSGVSRHTLAELNRRARAFTRMVASFRGPGRGS